MSPEPPLIAESESRWLEGGSEADWLEGRTQCAETWFRCPECGLVFSDGQPDPGRAWCSCGTSDSFPVLVIDGDGA